MGELSNPAVICVDLPLKAALNMRELSLLSTILIDMFQDSGMTTQSPYTKLGKYQLVSDDGTDAANARR